MNMFIMGVQIGLLACIGVSDATAAATYVATVSQPQKATRTAEADVAVLAKFEKDLARAVITNDTSVIEPMCADDFYSFDPTTGGRGTKAGLLANLRATDATVTEMTFPPFFVRIFGNTGIAQGTNEQTTLYQGKLIHGNYAWFDVFEKRNGRWYWIVSESPQVDGKVTDKLVCDQPFCATNQPGFVLKK